MSDTVKDFIMPLAVLSCVCLFISGALAVTGSITNPVITAAAEQRMEAAKRDILPDADGFVLIETENRPRTVSEVYGATNDIGYLFVVTVQGYGGEIRFICGINPDGRIIEVVTLQETETKGIATPVFDDVVPRLTGKDRHLAGIDAISGATITFNAYMNGILDAFSVFETVMAMEAR